MIKIKFDIEKYRQLEARAEQLNGVSRLAQERYREALLELQQREHRWIKRRDLVDQTLYTNNEEEILDHEEVAALRRDAEVARARFEQCDRERVASSERWTAAGRLFRACQDFLLAHGIVNPDAPHDQHSVNFGRRVAR